MEYLWSVTGVSSPFHNIVREVSSVEDEISAVPLVYRLSGLGPISRSSNAVRVSALNHFEAFLLMQQMPKCNELNEKIYLMQQFLKNLNLIWLM